MAINGMHPNIALSGVPVPICFPGLTLGTSVGPGSDGILIGAKAHQAVTATLTWQNAATPKGVVDTTNANSAGASDMALLPASPALSDGYYFGQTTPWFGMDLTIGTKAVSPAYTALWEYYTSAGSWATLTATLDESSDGTHGPFSVNGTGAKAMRFAPPSDWASVIVSPDTTAKYWVRARLSAFTSIGTVPLGSRVYIHDLASYTTAWKWPVAGVLRAVQWNAGTASGSNNDSVFLLVNLTRGTCQKFTMTKATVCGEDATLRMGMGQNDRFSIVQIGKDGSTEFANVQLWFRQDC